MFVFLYQDHWVEPVKKPPCTLQRLVQIKNQLFIGRKMKDFQQITILSASASFPIIAASQKVSDFQSTLVFVLSRSQHSNITVWFKKLCLSAVEQFQLIAQRLEFTATSSFDASLFSIHPV